MTIKIKAKEGIEQSRSVWFPEGAVTKVRYGTGPYVKISTKGEVWMDREEALAFAEQIRVAATPEGQK